MARESRKHPVRNAPTTLDRVESALEKLNDLAELGDLLSPAERELLDTAQDDLEQVKQLIATSA